MDVEFGDGVVADEAVTKRTFSKIVEDLVLEKPMPYMDAVILCSEKLGLEVEYTAKLLNKNIKDRLEVEAQNLNMMKGGDRLPI